MSKPAPISSFEFPTGHILADKYKVCELLGEGWEGEVYRVQELGTGIDRAAKVFFPHRDKGGKISAWYAKKLYTLRHCPIVIQYHSQEKISHQGRDVRILLSEYVEGRLFSRFLESAGGRLSDFEALHLLYALALGMEPIHKLREFHGDLHPENIIVRRCGLTFDLKLLDMYDWNSPRTENIKEDVYNLIKIFYQAIGGSEHYRHSSPAVKSIVCGLRRAKIFKKFRSARDLREQIELLSFR